MNQYDLRDHFIAVLNDGLAAKAISKKTGIPQYILSNFKTGKLFLCEEDAARLEEYLSIVVIP